MAARAPKLVTAQISLLGKDRSGVVARVTQLLFESGANIESLEEQVSRGFFSMSLLASWPAAKMPPARQAETRARLFDVGGKLQMETRVKFARHGEKQRMAVLVTKEAHCLDAILAAWKKGKLAAEPVVVISNWDDLAPRAKEAGVEFVHIPFERRAEAEKRLIEELDRRDVDFLVLARFMKILSPSFCWRYRNKILNIHPSLLPAFPGATAYRQAYEKGVRIVGVTAHFVTPDLDQGPIIMQDAFRVKPDEPLASLMARGQALESRVLLKAIDLYVKKRLDVHWGRVWGS